jgi:hypothetical protein
MALYYRNLLTEGKTETEEKTPATDAKKNIVPIPIRGVVGWNQSNEYKTALLLNEMLQNKFEQRTPPPDNAGESDTRIIDSERLKDYFNAAFKGMGNSQFNHFQSFVSELEKHRTAKAFAQIALMCYKRKQMSNRRPNKFSKWYGIFCE